MINKLGILRTHGSLFNLLNQCVDAGIILGSLVLVSSRVRFPWNRDFTVLACAAILLHYLAGMRNGLYQSWRMSTLAKEMLVTVKSWSTVFVALLVLLFLLGLTGTHLRRVFT